MVRGPEKRERFQLSDMEATKLSRLVEKHPSAAISLRTLSADDATELKTRLSDRLKLDASLDVPRFMKALRSRRRSVVSSNAESVNFNLVECLKFAGLVAEPRVYINWDRFQTIDSIALDILAQHLDDFWYPKADDIDIFDETCSWIVSIDYDGFVWVVT